VVVDNIPAINEPKKKTKFYEINRFSMVSQFTEKVSKVD
jgi:hypothetical protein